jgi:hypothetical protein
MITAPDQTGLINFISTNGRANRLGSCGLPSGVKQTDNEWFNTASFATAAPFTLPTDSVSEPNCRGPGLINFNTSLIRNIRYRERYNLQLRFESYNTFNHPLLQASGTNTTTVNSPQFGQIVTVGQSLEFAAWSAATVLTEACRAAWQAARRLSTQCHLLCELALWGRGFCPAAGLPPGAFCDEFAVIQRQK